MLNLTGIRTPSCLTENANPRRTKNGRKVKKIWRKPRPNILNRAAPTRTSGRQWLRSNSINIDRLTKLIEVGSEIRWLAEHGHEYAGQWVALEGGRLLTHGETAREVYDAVRRLGADLPLVVRVDSKEKLPFGGW